MGLYSGGLIIIRRIFYIYICIYNLIEKQLFTVQLHTQNIYSSITNRNLPWVQSRVTTSLLQYVKGPTSFPGLFPFEFGRPNSKGKSPGNEVVNGPLEPG